MTKIVVVGDVMLDVTIECEVSRVSPEAPVVVGRERCRRRALGGAANVAANLKALGVEEVDLYGDCGNDAAAAEIAALCASAGINYYNARTDDAGGATVKTRYTANAQLVFRHDIDRASSCTKDAQIRNTDTVNLEGADVVVFSDYDKGVVQAYDVGTLITRCHERAIPSVADCKPSNLPAFRGAAIITPNAAELTAMCDRYLPCSRDAGILASTYEFEWVVCTKGSFGIEAYTKPGLRNSTIVIPSEHTRKVYDVAGAGDVVVAAIASRMAANPHRAMREILEFANTAAGLSVEQPGTTTVTLDAVDAAQVQERALSKIVAVKPDVSVVASVVTRCAAGSSVVFTNGCFDLLHPGHVHLLRAARREGGFLVVAVNTDKSVRALKGEERPVLPLYLRMAALAAVDAVDLVVPFDEETPEALIHAIEPDVLVKGKHTTDCPYKNDPVPGAVFMEACGKKVVFVDTIPGYSTTAVLAGCVS